MQEEPSGLRGGRGCLVNEAGRMLSCLGLFGGLLFLSWQNGYDKALNNTDDKLKYFKYLK